MPVCNCAGFLSVFRDEGVLRLHWPPNDRDSYLRSTDVDLNGTAVR